MRRLMVRLTMLLGLMLPMLLTVPAGAATAATTQGDVAPMDIGAHGPNGHEIGARFTVTTMDGTHLGSCTLEGYGNEPYLVTCRVDVPRGTTVVVTLDVATITPGTVPVENPLYFDTSTNPGAASHWGVSFEVVPTGGSAGTSPGQSSDVAIVTMENGQPAYDACYVIVDYSEVGCDENGDGKVTFADIPWGAYTVRQTADLGPGRSVPDFTIEVRGNVNSAGFEAFGTTIVNATGGSASPSGFVDISLITRDPDTGGLLTDTCYVVVGYSNEGCDENGDGQVTFDDIPVGTWTVRQTRVPAGYPAVSDFAIDVPATAYPTGFVVRQASQPYAPGTRNVSVMLIDAATNTKVPMDACMQIVDVSNVGCDEDLVDGQIDFLDVLAGSHDIVVTRLPGGYTVANPNDLHIRIDAQSDPANLFVYLYVRRGGV